MYAEQCTDTVNTHSHTNAKSYKLWWQRYTNRRLFGRYQCLYRTHACVGMHVCVCWARLYCLWISLCVSVCLVCKACANNPVKSHISQKKRWWWVTIYEKQTMFIVLIMWREEEKKNGNHNNSTNINGAFYLITSLLAPLPLQKCVRWDRHC